MTQSLVVRLRAWWLKRRTTRLLSDCSDRQLADFGIAREAILAIAATAAEAQMRREYNDAPERRLTDCRVTAQA